LGLGDAAIRRRVAEMASFFGIEAWYHRSVLALSGGQKQILNLAAVMVMQPDLLILDEPSSQLDPIAAVEFFATLVKINDELGCTILLTEQRLEEVLPLVDVVHVMEGGRLTATDAPAGIGLALKRLGSPMLEAMPTPMRVALAVGDGVDCPVTVRDGRQWLERNGGRRAGEGGAGAGGEAEATLVQEGGDAAAAWEPAAWEPTGGEAGTGGDAAGDGKDGTGASPVGDGGRRARLDPAVLYMQEAWFRYDKQGEDVLRGLSIELRQGELLALVGGNGSGKSTALSVLAGLRRPYRGKVGMDGRRIDKAGTAAGPGRPADAVRPGAGGLILLPQDPQTVFLKETVYEDLATMLPHLGPEDARQAVLEVAGLVGMGEFMERHPYDLSGGEQQRAALAKVLLARPRILLLDEPTKGLDARCKQQLGELLADLRGRGMSVLMVSHDIEFSALYADRCALLFDGSIVSAGDARSFFAGNSFYTTAANRMARKLLPSAVVAEDIIGHLVEGRGCVTAA
jgi:energy-coupling factor transport system ATP-binding protein